MAKQKKTVTMLNTTLAADIAELHQEAHQYANKAIECALRAGEKLIKAKSEVPHGEWLNFVKETGVGERTAQGYIKLAKNHGRLKSATGVADLSIRAALKYLAVPKAKTSKIEATTPALESKTPVKTIPVEEGEECDLKGELAKEGRPMPGGISEDISPDISNDTPADETDDEPPDDTSIFSNPPTGITHAIDGDFIALDSAPSEDAEGEKQKKHESVEPESAAQIQESKSNPNNAERGKVAKHWEDDLVQIELSAAKYMPILEEKIGMDLMELALKFEKRISQSDTKR